ncbi:MAG TPA: Asp-tRNA(Asn)/Glu-tRNA(Gln) amidotransferase GatCAB subunit A, partial [Noviherbaspirillum sp.]|nr:Asp-tRNA(Asn)/Glu-tRNA(Gln) amidotransferase GatCAB subunit A [Noviherbaspirillum sp.]
MHKHTLKQLSAQLQARQVSASELAQHYLKRIEQSDLNAFLHVDAELTMEQAAEADRRIAAGDT